jgi:CheY-like chemotaxis protein
MKILIVDDDQNNLFTLESLIKEDIDTQLQIFKAESGQIALQILQQEQVDLIVLDVEMPEMNGFETAQIIRAQKETKDIPIVFITAAYDVEEFQEKGFTIDKMNYLTKPFDPDKFIRIIESYLN